MAVEKLTRRKENLRAYLVNSSLSLILLLLIISALTLVVFPLAVAIFGAFWSTAPYESGGQFTLQYFELILETPGIWEVFENTFIVAIVSTTIGVSFGTSIAVLVTRSQIPHAGLLSKLVYVPYIIPGYLAAAGWIFIMAPKIGFVSRFIQNVTGVTIPFYNEWWIGIAVGTHYVPLVYFLVAPGIRKIDSTMESASFVHGGNLFATMKNITFPLSKPAILSTIVIVFIRSFEEFAIALFIGFPSRTFVVSTRIFTALQYTSPPDYGLSTALAFILIIFGVGLLTLETVFLGAVQQYQTVSGQNYKIERVYDWGPVKNKAISFAAFAVLFFFTLLPLLMVVYASLKVPFTGRINLDLTLEMYRQLFSTPRFIRALGVTTIIALIGPGLLMVVAFMASYLLFRTDLRGAKLLDYLAFIPLSVPSVVTAVGFLWVYLFFTSDFLPLYGTLPGLLLALMSRYVPYATRAMHGGMASISDTLEEASLVNGNTPLGTVKDIIFPLVKGNFIYGYILLMMFFVKNLTVVLFLYQYPWQTLSIEIWNRWRESAWSAASAAATIMILLVLLLALVATKIGGLEETDM